MDTTIRQLPHESEVYDVRYLVKLASDRQHVTCVGPVDIVASCQVHPHMLRPRVSGETLNTLCVGFSTPWRIQSMAYITICDDRPYSEDQMALTVANYGTDDDKEADTFIPPRTLSMLEGYNLSSKSLIDALAGSQLIHRRRAETDVTFQFELTGTSEFQNVVLASLDHNMAPVSSFRVTLQFEVEGQTRSPTLHDPHSKRRVPSALGVIA